MNRTKHTPTPWVCHSGSVYQDGPDVFPKGSFDGIPIARMDRDTDRIQPTERDANAHFITHACNLYDELVFALKALHSCHRAFSNASNWTLLDDEARELAEKVLSKAEPDSTPRQFNVEIDVMDFDEEPDSHKTIDKTFFSPEERTAFIEGVETGLGWQEITEIRDTEV